MVEYEDEHYADSKYSYLEQDNPSITIQKLKVSKDNTITIRKVKDSWNREERNEDIIKALLSPDLIHTREQALIWIEENF